MVLFALVALMVAVGGLTRLTGSGLSITEWRPLSGALPPMSAADWAAEFDRYRAIPQYDIVNRGMTLAEFQVIYWWEWGHRQLGRLVGVVWLVGLAWLALTRRIPRGWALPLVGIGALGGLQGAIGWWMVASGLGEGMIAVASYRLAVHLGLAFLILGLLAWWIHALGRTGAGLMQARRLGSPGLARLGGVLVALAFLQIVLGALVAGIGAGRAYADWPLMHGVFFPPEALDMAPLWRNFVENPAMVQFTHRMAGYVLLAVGALTWVLAGASPHRATRGGHDLMMAVLTAQVALGIATVIWGAPWHLAIAHQLTAVLLWVVILRARFLARYPRVQSTIGHSTTGRTA
ncbi:heme A synthase [Rhodobaculum claviforme]|uniref:Heme A synthase n=2 Tax=Rhodobaculum claviforme TaxID=1549854 RepID=A0A934TIU7_9RHOB|nr:heme A synthase [Rhodobaculum claviforme]